MQWWLCNWCNIKIIMKTLKERLVHYFIIGIFVSLYFLVATISMINSVAFFDLSHSGLMSWSLAVGFEIGAAASLAAIIILDKTNKTMVWSLFLLLTAFQMMANSYHAFVNLEDYMGWIELFGLEEEEPIFQKRILSVVSGAVLPLVALGFIKSLTDYIRPEEYTDTKNESLDNLSTDIEDIKSKPSVNVTEEVNNNLVKPLGKAVEQSLSIEDIKNKPSDNVTEEVNNDPVKTLEKAVEESPSIENHEDDVLLKVDNATVGKTRLSRTKVHHVEKVDKLILDSPIESPSLPPRKHYNPKP